MALYIIYLVCGILFAISIYIGANYKKWEYNRAIRAPRKYRIKNGKKITVPRKAIKITSVTSRVDVNSTKSGFSSKDQYEAISDTVLSRPPEYTNVSTDHLMVKNWGDDKQTIYSQAFDPEFVDLYAILRKRKHIDIYISDEDPQYGYFDI